MDKGVKFVMNREEMKSLSAKQILIAKEKLELRQLELQTPRI